MELSKSFAIIGAGNGGQAFAAYLSLKGYPVKIYDVSQKTIDILQSECIGTSRTYTALYW